ncbi:Eco57I restriction-modification methylase domain-containing protein [Epilithonimonas vandammei]|uniref:Eco57I restriction-modification methylase domain-containing protein n=1 Tax=Epilithonimonas vandammei TaxID=2487072 RepID=UPI0028A24327|nr:TaqI-like C-terminal specificity domain-containing protein [Epilithonimonas vandammei]
MSLFQKTIINKYLKLQNQDQLNKKWDLFCKHFHNAEIQENIRNSKEEQYQGEFLIDLFVDVLGYTKNPTPHFNLTTEYKNVKDSKKADGAIIISDKVLAIIELKGTNTTDLSKIETQAFGYKNNQPDCKYVITSNFEKLRFYIDNAIEHLEFNLFELTKGDFELLYLCLAFENISADIPAKIKNESVSKEDEITKKLYKDYSVFKRELFKNLSEQNPEFDPLELFKKSQKLLDRLLFLFFGEDRGLLPPNSVRLILEQWNKLKELDEYVPLYDRFKKYFGYLNTGFKGKQFDVFAYNGGLFKPDEILDNITIDDTLLYNHTLKLAEYDFASEVDVNILGHIFENSLNEIDEIKAQLEGQEIDKSKTKRKKDGVFYTPKYITKYIVENTVGKLCEEKKTELGIAEEDYSTDKKRQQKTKLALLQKLEDYRTWLHQITIIDPACGSGAFLNEALNFLIDEHKYIDELEAKLTGSSIAFAYHSESILENNLFGVDLNEESVEIAKLSLWLRTAEPNRKLNDLSNNIKCGNSLIDDPEIAGDKAFNWEKEFPQIFAKGGFDVVIGNPPYVLCQPSNTNEETLNFYKSFEVASYKIDLFHLFFERGTNILRDGGELGFITPNTYLSNKYIQKLRNFILKNTFIEKVINYNEIVFVDAGVDVATLILTKDKIKNENIKIYNSERGELKFITNKSQNSWNEAEEQVFNLKNDFFFEFKDCVKLEEIGNTYFGIQAYDRKSSISDKKINENYISIIDGADVVRFQYSIPNKYFNYLFENIKSGGDLNVYSQDRIVISQIGQSPKVGFCEKGILTSNTIYNLFLKDSRFSLKYILAILNSQLIKSYWLSKYNDNKDLFPKIKGYQLKQLPIKEISLENQQPFIKKADQMLSLNKELQELSAKFQRNLQREFTLETLSKKLQNWYELSFAEFLKELAKAKVNLALSQKAEWEDYFLAEQQKAISIKSQIDQTDKEIDQMVYELYGLTDEEIEIVENS